MEEIDEIFRNIKKKGNRISYKCKYCKDTGFEYDKETNTAKRCRCGLIDTRLINNRLKFASIPDTYSGLTLSDYNTNVYKLEKNKKKAVSAMKAIRYWVDNFYIVSRKGIGLYLYSNAKGSGKTMLAACIANEIINKGGASVRFATSIQILNEIKATWKNKDESESELLKYLCLTDVLVIDDFGTETVKDWMEERIYHLINQRYIDKKPTILTSNYKLSDIKYNDRIINRINERTYQIPFPEESVRDIIASQNMKKLADAIINQKPV